MPPLPSPNLDDGGLTELVGLHRRVCLSGPIGAGKTEALIRHVEGLRGASGGTPGILVLVAPGELRRWHGTGVAGGPVTVTTLSRWLRHELETFWPLIEASGVLPQAAPGREQRLVVFAPAAYARYRMAEATREHRETRGWHRSLMARPEAQVYQLMETHVTALEEGLDLDAVGDRLTRAWSGSEAARQGREDIPALIMAYREAAWRDRVLDAAMQQDAYLRLLWPLAEYREGLRMRVRHLIIDDETLWTPLAAIILQMLSEDMASVVVARSSHEEGLFAEWPLVSIDRPASPASLVACGQAIADHFAKSAPSPVVPDERLVARLDFASRPAMVEAMLQDLRGLLAAGIAPERVAVVAPRWDRYLGWAVAGGLARWGVPHRFLTPWSRLSEELVVQALLTVARLAYPRPDAPVGRQALQALADTLLEGDPFLAADFAASLAASLAAPAGTTLSIGPRSVQVARDRLESFLARHAEDGPWPLGYFFRAAAVELAFPGQHAATLDHLTAAAARFESAVAQPAGWNAAQAIDHFLAFMQQGGLFGASASETGLVLATARSYAESGPPVDFQFWLDFGHEAWLRTSQRELSHPWVLSQDWHSRPLAEEQADAERRLGLEVQAILLRARQAVRWYGAAVDEEGREQNGLLPEAWAGVQAAQYAGLGSGS